MRCVYAYPQGLHLPFLLRARGVQAEAAARRRVGAHGRGRGPGVVREGAERDPLADVQVLVKVDGLRGVTDPSQTSSSSGQDAYDMEATYRIGQLPADRRLLVTVSWSAAGLPESTTEVALDDLSDLQRRVLLLP